MRSGLGVGGWLNPGFAVPQKVYTKQGEMDMLMDAARSLWCPSSQLLGAVTPDVEQIILSSEMNPGMTSSTYVELLGNVNNLERIKAEVQKLKSIRKEKEFYVVGIRTHLYSFTGATGLVQVLVYTQ